MKRKMLFIIALLVCAIASFQASIMEYRPGHVVLDGYGHVMGCVSPGNQCYYVYWKFFDLP